MGLDMNLQLIIAELRTPSGQTGPLGAAYARGAQAAWHMVLGAAVAWPMGNAQWLFGLLVAVAYWLAKERGDLRRGGGFCDGVEDAACVYLGTFAGPVWWGAVALAASGYVMITGAWRR